jgi:hypothetical protein
MVALELALMQSPLAPGVANIVSFRHEPFTRVPDQRIAFDRQCGRQLLYTSESPRSGQGFTSSKPNQGHSRPDDPKCSVMAKCYRAGPNLHLTTKKDDEYFQ